MFDLFWVPNFIKIGHIAILKPNLLNKVFNFGSAISNIIFMINELDLLWLPNFIVLGVCFIFGTKFSLNEGIDAYFNGEYVLLGRNFDFLGGCLVVTACCWWLLLVTARCYSFPLLVWTTIATLLDALSVGTRTKFFWSALTLFRMGGGGGGGAKRSHLTVFPL